MHIHLGVLFALQVFANVVIVGFLWRMAAVYLKDTALGHAMAFIY